MVEIQDGGYSSGLYKNCCAPHMFEFPLYIHNRKKACFVRLRGCPYDPHTFGCHPVCLDATICLDAPPVYLNAPVCLDAAICVDTPCMFGYPPCVWIPTCMIGHPHVCIPPYVWMPPVCLGAPLCWKPSVWLDAPTCLDALHLFGCPPVCLDAAKCMVASKGVRDI